MDLDFLKKEALENAEYARSIRRVIHRNPELSGKETATAGLVCGELEKMGIEYTLMDDINAVVGIIRSGKEGKTLAIRADMDALPIQEETGLPFASENPGVMHACGHDVHTSVLLGTAALLQKNKDKFCGNVKLFFQPNEEGSGGAEPMIARGCMEDPHVDGAIALHVAPDIPAGTIGSRRGAVNACTGTLMIDIDGVSCHGAHPEGGVDAILIAGQLINAIYALAVRRVSGTDPMMLTIGRINGGTAANIVCGHVSMAMTLRTINRDTRKRFISEVTTLVENTCAAFGGKGTVTVNEGYINLFNDDKMYDRLEKLSVQMIGEGKLIERADPSMGGEDFSYFGEHAPAVMYDLGVGFADREESMALHSCTFYPNEDAFYYGILMHSAYAIDFLNE